MKTEDNIVGSGQRRRKNAPPAPERIESQSTSSPVPRSVRALGFSWDSLFNFFFLTIRVDSVYLSIILKLNCLGERSEH